MRGTTKAAAIILAFLCMVMGSCELPGPWVTVFNDDFNRDNNADVGNGWSPMPPSGSPPPSAAISGHALLMTGGSDGPAAPAHATIVRSASLGGDFRVTFSFGFPGVASWAYLVVVGDFSHRYAIGFQPGSLGIWKDGTPLSGGVGAPLNPDDDFALEIVREDAEITVVVTDTTTSAQWTATSTDDDYHDFTSIHLWGGNYEGTATSTWIDDFVLQTR